MIRFASFTIGLALVASSAAAQLNIAQTLPTDQEAALHGLARAWYSFAPIDGTREAVQSVRVLGTQLHLQTNSSRIHVMDTESGKLLWSAQMGIPVPGQFGSAINSDSVFVINGTKLYRLDRDSGYQLWSLRLPHAPNAAPSADDTFVAINTLDGRISLYNIHNKERLWFYQTNGPISVPPVLIDGKIVCASQDGRMYVFQPSSRNPTLRYQTQAPVSAPLAIWGRAVLLPSQDYNLYSVDVRTAETLWRYSSGSEIRKPVSIVENDVYMTPAEGGMHAVNAETGGQIWRHPRAEDFVAASKTRVYAADQFGQLLILDRASGRQVDAWILNQFKFRVRNDESDRIYLVTKTGLIVCLHEPENKTPLVHRKVLPPAPASAGRMPAETTEN